jgi:hypothetical protein
VRLAVLVLAVALASGCAPHLAGERGPRVRAVEAGGARFRIVYWPEDEDSVDQVAGALATAVGRVARWGGLVAPVTVTVYPTHERLEAAVRRPGYDWLRAWARYGRIDLQSPRTWRLFGARDADVVELVTHELAHCAMYQQAGSEYTWPFKGEPLWFREGLASVTADQGYRRGDLEELWEYYSRGGAEDDAALPPGGGAGGDPIANPEPLYQRHADLVYGAAHHAFRFLLDRHGEARIRRILAGMAAGKGFDDAFRAAVGIGEREFAAEFRRYVMAQGWRR